VPNKIFCFTEIILIADPNQWTIVAILSREEGRRPSSRTLGQDAVDAAAQLTSGADAYGEDVWS
jgi:hypothetical protein